MSDKRQRARVQGSWAKQLPKHSGPTGTVPNNQQPKSVNPALASWGFGPQKTPKTFEFHQPTKPIRDVPPEKVIEQAGDHEISHGPSGVSRLQLLPAFLHPENADWMFSKLLAELPWSQKTNYRQGEAYEEPRLTCWYGELPYTYARSTMAANTQWHPLLLTLRETVEQVSGCSFNSLLCNLYRDGHDSIGWHSDDEASLGDKPTIASLSLGDTRVFSLRKQPPPEENGDYTYVERIRVPLHHGTLLLMAGATQDDWQHQVAKEYHDRGPRINLTFRTIYAEPEGHMAGTKL
ncbi:alpha-ketoglutarate-dependent dioxygenase alkB homolog 3 isoform X2 [Siniperca chuatsi]|uniref:alpha-ketoglutarate-dependent dioxygenase alkB homolog 3 isoform X2 n=1 Tax=Siniperca chuatsi TaxID=119488 RepID=UPI001CE1F821|nr:alpha-ketoglutarate-dependent dioxygenase alkB homolog 3 isoform X2 [Siniperca chuatsi]XP_044048620.1 alpha-ketoglutarate-dependent dioxygenase alkB homolog 3 isoform X2 [Siniperca chuatsi]